MGAVLGVLKTVGSVAGSVFGVIGSIFGVAGKAFSNVGDILTKFGIAVFLAGFFGILLAFLWFFFRYLDEKKLTLPAALFTLFFFVFLSGNLLLIARDAQLRDAQAKDELVQAESANTSVDAEGTEEVEDGEIAV